MLRIFVLLAAAFPVLAQAKPEAFAFDLQARVVKSEYDAPCIHSLAWSPDGNFLAVGNDDGTIALVYQDGTTPKQTIDGHRDAVHALVWFADGSRFASASADRTVVIWNARTRQPVITLKHAGPVFALALSPDGKTIATGGFDKIVREWDASTGAEIRRHVGHTASVRCLAYASDGRRLASSGADFSVRIWSATGSSELRGHRKSVRALSWLGDGRLVSASDDGTARIWHRNLDEEATTFGPYADAIASLATSPRGTFLALGHGSGRIHIIDPERSALRCVLTASNDACTAIAISPDGRQLAAGGFDRMVRIWQALEKQGEPEATYSTGGRPLRAVCASPDGLLVAVGSDNGDVRVFDAISAKELKRLAAHASAIEDLAFSGDGKTLVTAGADRSAKVWRWQTNALVKEYPEHPGPVRRVAITANGALLATGTNDADVRLFDVSGNSAMCRLAADGPPQDLQFIGNDTLLTAGGARVYLWDVAGARVLDTLDGGQFARVTAASASADASLVVIAGEPLAGSQRDDETGTTRVLAVSRARPRAISQRLIDTGVGVLRVQVSQDGRIFAVVSGDAAVHTWEWPGQIPIRKVQAHAAAVLGLALSPRGEFVVTASADGTAKRWSAARGAPLVYAAKLTDESTQAWFARAAPDGQVAVSGGDDKLLRIRRGLPGEFRILPGDYSAAYASALSPDGATLATGHHDGVIHLWDAKSGQAIRKLTGHTFRVWSLAWTPDGKQLVSGGGNSDDSMPGELRVWSTATWQVTHEIGAGNGHVFSVAIAPDGKTVATGNRDNHLRTYDLTTGKAGWSVRMPGYARCVVYSKDGAQIFACGPNAALQWFAAQDGTPLGSFDVPDGQIERIALAPGGDEISLAIKSTTKEPGGFTIGIWDTETKQLVRRFAGKHRYQINALAYSPDGRTLVSAGGRQVGEPVYHTGPVGPWGTSDPPDSSPAGNRSSIREFNPVCEIKAWDVRSGTPLAELPGQKYLVEALTFTADGASLLTAAGVAGKPGELRLWSSAGLRPQAVLSMPSGLICGQFSPDGKHFAVGCANGATIVCDIGRCLTGRDDKTSLLGHSGRVRHLVWSRDGRQLITAGDDGTVRVWDWAGKKPVRTWTAHDRPVYGLALSHDGLLLATTAGQWQDKKDGQTRVWTLATGVETFRLPDRLTSTWGAAFTADGNIVTAHTDDVALRLFDTKSRAELRAIATPMHARGLTMSPDGKRLAVTSQFNGLVRIWETGTWREEFEITAHPGKDVFSLDFAPDGKTMLTAGGDGAVVVWKTQGGDFTIPPPKLTPAKGRRPNRFPDPK